jgi:hypothetical protein
VGCPLKKEPDIYGVQIYMETRHIYGLDIDGDQIHIYISGIHIYKETVMYAARGFKDGYDNAAHGCGMPPKEGARLT